MRIFLFLSIFAFTSVLKAETAPLFDADSQKYFVGPSATFLSEASSNGANNRHLEVSVDGNEFESYRGSVRFHREGKHSVSFRLEGADAKQGLVQTTDVFADLTPPTTQWEFRDPPEVVVNGQTYINLKSVLHLRAEDNLSGVASTEYSRDNSHFTPYSQPLPMEKLGKQTLYYRSSDRVGNAEPTREKTFIVDAVPPVSRLQVHGNGQSLMVQGQSYLAVSDAASIGIEASDEGSQVKTIWVSTDGQASYPYTKPVFLLKEGPHTLSYYAEDNTGNKETPRTVAFFTVSRAPKTEAVFSTDTVSVDGVRYIKPEALLKLRTRDTLVGIERTEFKIDGETQYRAYLEPITFKAPGFHTVVYRSQDRAGNVEPLQTLRLNVVAQAPQTQVELKQPPQVRDGITYLTAPNVITLKAVAGPVGVKETWISLDEGPYQPYLRPIEVSDQKPVLKIAFKSVDRLGNEETPKTVTYRTVGLAAAKHRFAAPTASDERAREQYFQASPLLFPTPR